MKYLFLMLLPIVLFSGLSAQQTCMTPARVAPVPAFLNPDPLNGDYCVSVYIEVDYDIVQDKGETGAEDYINSLMSEVAYLYERDGISLNWTTLLWKTPSPYSGNSSSELLTQFRLHRTNYDGDVAMLLSYQASGGIAFVDVLCSGQFGYAFSSIQPTYETYPDYSWSVMVIAHELGHNLGSPHTQSCVWNGNNTPIDGCFPAEGNCGTAPIPTEGGTIMSYCHLKPVGINMTKGFGPQPLALIKNRIAGAGCVECTEGPDEPENDLCDDNRIIMEIQLDNYPQETSWRVTNADGAVVGYSEPYAKNQMNTYHSDTLCLPDGCYSLIVDDVDGLGGYGCSEGLYVLNGPDGELSSGQVFKGSEITRFCFGGPSGCNPPDLDAGNFTPYSNQDKTDDIENESGGVVLRGNTWQATPYQYTVKSSTVLTGDVWVETVGEIHAIGLVEQTRSLAPGLTFRLAGTQRWGRPDEQVETGSWQTFSIALGQHVPLVQYNYLLLVNDHDPDGAIVTKWRNIDVCESGAEMLRNLVIPVEGLVSDENVAVNIDHSPYCRSLSVGLSYPSTYFPCDCGFDETVVEDIILKPHPNPVTDTLNLPAPAVWFLYSSTGQLVETGYGNKVKMALLPPGVYLLYTEGQTHKIVK